MKLSLILPLLLMTAAGPLAAQGDRTVKFDALMNNEAEMAGAKIQFDVVLKNVHGLPKQAVHAEAWASPVGLSSIVNDRRAARDSQWLLVAVEAVVMALAALWLWRSSGPVS